MDIAAHHRNRMLPAECGDPSVVGRNRLASTLEFQPDGCVVPRSLSSNIKDGASVEHSLQRHFVRLAVARLRDAESEFPGYNDGDRKLLSLGHDLNRSRRSVKISGKSIGVENQVQSSGSICSNSSSMIFPAPSAWPW